MNFSFWSLSKNYYADNLSMQGNLRFFELRPRERHCINIQTYIMQTRLAGARLVNFNPLRFTFIIYTNIKSIKYACIAQVSTLITMSMLSKIYLWISKSSSTDTLPTGIPSLI